MAKPATTARLEAAAKGFTEVIKRGDNHIVTKNPTTGKCAYDGPMLGFSSNHGLHSDLRDGIGHWIR